MSPMLREIKRSTLVPLITDHCCTAGPAVFLQNFNACGIVIYELILLACRVHEKPKKN